MAVAMFICIKQVFYSWLKPEKFTFTNSGRVPLQLIWILFSVKIDWLFVV